jgi:CheY-like chemotaxis protein
VDKRAALSAAPRPEAPVRNVTIAPRREGYDFLVQGQDRIYSRSSTGSEVLASVDTAVPTDYRRLLALIEGETHSDVIRGSLRQYPDSLLVDWLAELEEIGYVSSRPADTTQDLDFTALLSASPKVRRVVPEDRPRIESQARGARGALYHQGVFLSPDRLKNRAPLRKRPGEIVVLIVEDDPDQAALADLRVSMAGYQVRLARNSNELVNEIRTRAPPDAVLLDIMLPDGNGFDILASFRRHPKLALLPVMLLTVLAAPEDVRRGLALGADGYITKPYSKKILTETIRTVLKHA